jgi:hypothetical protein
MPHEEANHVALYIDWDNLAISTAADFGGAVPDVHAIVQAAQRFGAILTARAYAEWQVPSDRLSVYKAGVEPVYAPTFRFEPETAGQAPRGKSIADPCLVTDAIDTLHLMPSITHFVLVSGDKDLIPVVRLAQLRGKKVVVIGPEQVAQVLREMCDEYVAYRSLIDVQATTAAAEQSSSDSRRRRGAQTSSRATHTALSQPMQAQPSQAQPVQPQAQLAPVVSAPQAPVPSPLRPHRLGQHTRHVQSDLPSLPQAREEVTSVATVEPTPPTATLPAVIEMPRRLEPMVVPAQPALEPAREEQTTRVQDRPVAKADLSTLLPVIEAILQERESQKRPRLRATNLKDLLVSRISGFSERDYGFVGFRELIGAVEQSGIVIVHRAGPVQMIELAKDRAPREDPTEVAAPSEEPRPVADDGGPIDMDVIRFIADLRGRSKWLTYTYVLTNLVTHLSERTPGQSVDRESRAALDKLVQAGVLRVDREPREIEVAGTRHRVRMCHLEADHPLVRQAIAAGGGELPAQSAAPDAPAPVDVVTEAPAPEPVVVPAATVGGALDPLPSALLDYLDGSAALSPVARAPLFTTDPPASEPVAVLEPEPAEAPGPELAPEAVTAPASEPVVLSESLTLDAAMDALRTVVAGAVTNTRPTLGPAGVKTRLTKALGLFDERMLGFSKFKDFLLEAEKRGIISVESSGASTRVGKPTSVGSE